MNIDQKRSKGKLNLARQLLVAIMVLMLSACFESNSEQAAPALITKSDLIPPILADDSLSIPPNQAGVVHVLNNDRPVGQGRLTIIDYSKQSVQGATVSDNGDGSITYTPLQDFTGEDSFTYTALDSAGGSSVASVIVTVSTEVIPNGKVYYVRHCAICHAAGTDDTSVAFRASDLALRKNPIVNDLTPFNGSLELMGAFTQIPQKNVDELKAYVATLVVPAS